MSQINSAPPRREESPERLARPLIQLAKGCGVATCYIDQLGTYVEIRDAVLISVLGALGVDASTPELVDINLNARRNEAHERLVAPTVVKFLGTPASTPLHTKHGEPHIGLTLEDGSDATDALSLTFREHDGDVDVYDLAIGDNLEIGYHTLHVRDGETGSERDVDVTLLCAPASIPVPEALASHKRWGWMTQMYSVRSPESWGVGDYGDLRELLVDAAGSGADFMLINPVHASAPVSPIEPSPYSPMSRRFINTTYIRPQDIAEFAELDEQDAAAVRALHEQVAPMNTESSPMDLDAAWKAKRAALQIIFRQPRSPERQASFEAFKEKAGADLDTWALWSVAFEVLGEPWEPDSWFRMTAKSNPRIQALRTEHPDLYEFACWLQWIAEEQLDAAQRAARDAGMSLGLMQDMAVGVHSYGADAWGNPERFAVGSVTVGCPPDFYNQQGQDWGQPPLNPNYLELTGYRMYREMVHHMFEHAGAIRIDHILGLFRLWWIPAGQGAKGGAYVTYNYDAMIAVLSIEATRVNGIVIGEDLGTVPDFVRNVLARHGLLGTTVEWFARVDDSPQRRRPVRDAADVPHILTFVGHHTRSAADRRLSHARAGQTARGARPAHRAGGGVPRIRARRTAGHARPARAGRLDESGGRRRCAGQSADHCRGDARHAHRRAFAAAAGRARGRRGRGARAEPAGDVHAVPKLAYSARRRASQGGAHAGGVQVAARAGAGEDHEPH